MSYRVLLVLLCCMGGVLSGCTSKEQGATNSTIESTSSVMKEIKTTNSTENKQASIVGKNFQGKMGKHTLAFTFLKGNKYKKVSDYSVVGEKSITYTEGEYLIHGDEIILRPSTNKTYTVLPTNPSKYLALDEHSTKSDFERLYLEDDGSILLTYGLKKDEVKNQSVSDDTYSILSEDKTAVKTFDEAKKEMQPTKDTRALFKTVDAFGEWVLAHMYQSKSNGYSYRVLSDENTEGDYRYSVNIYVPGFEKAPGTTIAIDYDGNMYNDMPRDGQPRNLSRDTSWDQILDTDIAAGEIVKSPANKGKEKLQEMVGKWGVVPGDSFFTIVSDSEVEIFRGPGEPIEKKQVEEVTLDGNTLTIVLTDKTMTLELIDDQTIKMGETTYKKIE